MLAATAMLLENSAVNMVDWRADEVGQVFAVRERLSSTAEPEAAASAYHRPVNLMTRLVTSGRSI